MTIKVYNLRPGMWKQEEGRWEGYITAVVRRRAVNEANAKPEVSEIVPYEWRFENGVWRSRIYAYVRRGGDRELALFQVAFSKGRFSAELDELGEGEIPSDAAEIAQAFAELPETIRYFEETLARIEIAERLAKEKVIPALSVKTDDYLRERGLFSYFDLEGFDLDFHAHVSFWNGLQLEELSAYSPHTVLLKPERPKPAALNLASRLGEGAKKELLRRLLASSQHRIRLALKKKKGERHERL